MNTCYICKKPLSSENASTEHIIPNACGGKLKSKEILCKTCNSTLGQNIDAELAKQVNFFSVMFDVNRDRGVHPAEPSANGDYAIKSGGKPIRLKTESECIYLGNREYKIRVEAPTKERAFHEIRKIRAEKKLNISDEMISEYLKNLSFAEEKLDPLHMSLSVGGPMVLRAVAKIALNFYMYLNGELKFIDPQVLESIQGTLKYNCAMPFYPKSYPFEISSKHVSHLIFLRGEPSRGDLICYIELFNVFCYLVQLSKNYQGAPIALFYEYDLKNQKNISTCRKILPDFKKEDFPSKIEQSFYPIVKSRFSQVLQIAKFDQMTQLAMERSLLKYPEGIPLTKEMLAEFSSELTKIIMQHITAKNGNLLT